MTLPPDTKLDQYEILSFIGSDGMGEVYKAKDLKLGRPVAVKVLHKEHATDPERLSRFEQEARAASALDHPNIVTIFGISEVGGLHFIVMQFVDGKTLRELIAGGRLGLSQILSISIQVADGLAKAHSVGIAHRDLKPDNIMITEDSLVIIGAGRMARVYEARISSY